MSKYATDLAVYVEIFFLHRRGIFNLKLFVTLIQNAINRVKQSSNGNTVDMAKHELFGE